MTDQPPVTNQLPESPHVAPAVEEEQRLLNEFMQQQQVQYLLNRCIALNIAARTIADAELAVVPRRGGPTDLA